MKRDPTDEQLRALARPVPPPPVGEAQRIQRRLMTEALAASGLKSFFSRRWFLVPLAAGFAVAALLLVRPAELSPAADDAELAVFLAETYVDVDLNEGDGDEVLYMAELGLR